MPRDEVPLLDVLLGTGRAERRGAPEPSLLPHLVPIAPAASLRFACYLANLFGGGMPRWPALGGAILHAVAQRLVASPSIAESASSAFDAALTNALWFVPAGEVGDRVRARRAPAGDRSAMLESAPWLALAADLRQPVVDATVANGVADALFRRLGGGDRDGMRVTLLSHVLPWQTPGDRAQAIRSAIGLLREVRFGPPWLVALALSRLSAAGTEATIVDLAPEVARLAETWTAEVADLLVRPVGLAPFDDVLRAHPGAGRLLSLDAASRAAVHAELAARVPDVLDDIVGRWGGAGPPRTGYRSTPQAGGDPATGPTRDLPSSASAVQPREGSTRAEPPVPVSVPPASSPEALPAPVGAEPPPAALRPVESHAQAAADLVASIPRSPAPGIPAPQAGAPEAEPAEVAAFAPPSVPCGTTFLVQVMLYPPPAAQEAERMSREVDATAGRRATYALPMDLLRGARVDVHLELSGLVIDEPDAWVTWRGTIAPLQFEVQAPLGAAVGTSIGRVTIAVDGVPAGKMRFQVGVQPPGATIAPIAASPVEAHRFRRAFVSYASVDRAEVLKRVQAFKVLHLEVFQDILSLEPGERWERGLYKAIDECDVFMLFWSSAAKASEWVDREIDYALARQGARADHLPDIQPVPIEGPPIVVPPAKLGHLHFNDALLAHIKGATPG